MLILVIALFNKYTFEPVGYNGMIKIEEHI